MVWTISNGKEDQKRLFDETSMVQLQGTVEKAVFFSQGNWEYIDIPERVFSAQGNS